MCDQGSQYRTIKTLDVDILTYEQLYIRTTPGLNASTYTLPVIPADYSATKQFVYLTPLQALSVGGIYFTTSTIPQLLSDIAAISTHQAGTDLVVSSQSSVVGCNIDYLTEQTQRYINIVIGTTYDAAYNQMYAAYSLAGSTNNASLLMQSNVYQLQSNVSSVSTIIASTFSSLNRRLDVEYNQGPSVSSLSTYFTTYFRNLSESISSFSTSVGQGISTNSAYQTSSLNYYAREIQTIVQQGAGPGVSTLSTFITSSFLSISRVLFSYNPGPGLSSMSTFMVSSLSSLSTQFNIQLAVPGICSLSTNFSRAYICTLSNAYTLAGISQLSSLSTAVTSNASSLSNYIFVQSGADGVSSLSTTVGKDVAVIYDLVSTTNFAYILLQQEIVKQSISALSTQWGRDYRNLASLCTFSTMLPSAYSTLSTIFDTVTPSNTINRISTALVSTLTFASSYISTFLPAAYAGPGLSSLSTVIPLQFSSMSTSLGIQFSSLQNNVGNISSLRTDVGVSSLSTFMTYSTLALQTSFQDLFSTTQAISLSTATILSSISDLRAYDAFVYSTVNYPYTLDVWTSTLVYQVNEISTSLYTDLPPALSTMSNLSSFISTSFSTLNTSFINLQSTFISTAGVMASNYNTISSLAGSNLTSPLFSTFFANNIITSSLVIENDLHVSSLSLNLSTGNGYSLAVKGGAKFIPDIGDGVKYVIVGDASGSSAIYTSRSAASNYTNTASGQFNVAGYDVAFGGGRWVAVGNDTNKSALIKTSVAPSTSWANATITGSAIALSTIQTVKYAKSYWLAGGGSNPTLYKSPDGNTWTPTDNGDTLAYVNSLAYNGFRWAATGISSLKAGSPYTVVYSDDNGSTWTAASNTFQESGRAIATNGQTWIAVGKGIPSIKYSLDAINWNNITNIGFSTQANCVVWNGEKFVVGGENGNGRNLAYSYNGLTWYPAAIAGSNTFISTAVTNVAWDGSVWTAGGFNSRTDTSGVQLLSYDAISWSTTTTRPGVIRGSAFASNTTPIMSFSNFDIYTSEIPVIMDSRKRMQVIQSTIMFNDGDLTIRRVLSSQNYGFVGINTTYPEYALDIGIGNARKPLGTTWVTASDARVKRDIKPADYAACAKLIEQIPLRQFRFSKEYRAATQVPDTEVYGFIAQEVKAAIPTAVNVAPEFGISDFHSLDADQLHKAEFGATKYLLAKIEELEAKISTLEGAK